MSTPGNGKQLLNSLTSLRFFAALLVFLWHTHLWGNHLDRYQLGYAGVSFFYMLSGFVLTYAYYKRITIGKFTAIKSYYIARIAKIYPVHLLTFALAIPLAFYVVHASGVAEFLKQAVANVFLVQSFSPHIPYYFAFNAVSWSISDELFFYLLMPVFIFIAFRLRNKLSIGKLVLSMLVIWIAMVALLTGKVAVLDQWAYYVLPLIRLPDFVLGILLCLVYWKSQSTKLNSIRTT
jgi:peptidoglycan/LPS O-acetylase OafA/YrhL